MDKDGPSMASKKYRVSTLRKKKNRSAGEDAIGVAV